MTSSQPRPATTERRWLDRAGNPIDEEDRGLVYDVGTLVDRRRLLGLFGGIGAAGLLAACGSDTGRAAGSGASADLIEVPDETGGPYPGDGSNGVNVLDDSGIVRSDIRSSFGSSTTTAPGVPLRVRLTVRDASTGTAMPGAAVYLWHCTADGAYSLYSPGLEGESFLRGVLEADDSGTVEFRSVFPGCYDGRWPHIHFEVYAGVDDAVSSGPIVKTSQIALPQEACDAVYATSGYEASTGNLARTSLAQDMVFGDDRGIHQLASMAGDVDRGYVATLTFGV